MGDWGVSILAGMLGGGGQAMTNLGAWREQAQQDEFTRQRIAIAQQQQAAEEAYRNRVQDWQEKQAYIQPTELRGMATAMGIPLQEGWDQSATGLGIRKELATELLKAGIERQKNIDAADSLQAMFGLKGTATAAAGAPTAALTPTYSASDIPGITTRTDAPVISAPTGMADSGVAAGGYTPTQGAQILIGMLRSGKTVPPEFLKEVAAGAQLEQQQRRASQAAQAFLTQGTTEAPMPEGQLGPGVPIVDPRARMVATAVQYGAKPDEAIKSATDYFKPTDIGAHGTLLPNGQIIGAPKTIGEQLRDLQGSGLFGGGTPPSGAPTAADQGAAPTWPGATSSTAAPPGGLNAAPQGGMFATMNPNVEVTPSGVNVRFGTPTDIRDQKAVEMYGGVFNNINHEQRVAVNNAVIQDTMGSDRQLTQAALTKFPNNPDAQAKYISQELAARTGTIQAARINAEAQLKPMDNQEADNVARQVGILNALTELKQYSPDEIRQYVGLVGRPRSEIAQKLAGVAQTLGMDVPVNDRFAKFETIMGRLQSSAFGVGGKQLTPFEYQVVASFTPTGTEANAQAVYQKVTHLEAFVRADREARIYLMRTGKGMIDESALDAMLQKQMDAAGIPLPKAHPAWGNPGAWTNPVGGGDPNRPAGFNPGGVKR